MRETIAYIVPTLGTHTAIDINIQRRMAAMENAGFKVLLFEHTKKTYVHTVIRLLRMRNKFNHIVIRIDGSCILDKYTFWKCILLKHHFIWEIHGSPEERLEVNTAIESYFFVWKNALRRRILSYLVDVCIFISGELYEYSKRKIQIKKWQIIPNFVPSSHKQATSQSFRFPFKKISFVVIWGGDASLPWQATDIIYKVAKIIEAKDRHVLFLLFGKNNYYSRHNSPNILHLNPIPYAQYMNYVKESHICLALYHKPSHFPFYFHSMKLLDYLAYGKPIIASDMGTLSAFIRSSGGILTENNPERISDAILALKRNKRAYLAIAKKARQAARTLFSEKQIHKLYRDCIA